MPRSQKPIVCICGSRAIDYINLNMFINPSSVGQIISGGAIGIDLLAKQWAYANKIEYQEFKPNYKIFKDKAPLMRDKDMVDYCDIVIAFWDGKSTGTAYTFNYAASIGRSCIIHKIISTD